MHFRGTVVWVVAIGALAFACSKGGSGAKSGKGGDAKTVFDEEGNGFECESPDTQCEEVKDPSLDFKEHCRMAGYRIQQCGCSNACTGNINGERSGFDRKNTEKKCGKADDKCEMPETSAAFDDACSSAGFQMIECGCEWLCSGKLKETLPDPPKEEEKKPEEESKDGDKKDDAKKDGGKKDEKPSSPASMDGPIKEPKDSKKKK